MKRPIFILTIASVGALAIAATDLSIARHSFMPILLAAFVAAGSFLPVGDVVSGSDPELDPYYREAANITRIAFMLFMAFMMATYPELHMSGRTFWIVAGCFTGAIIAIGIITQIRTFPIRRARMRALLEAKMAQRKGADAGGTQA